MSPPRSRKLFPVLASLVSLGFMLLLLEGLLRLLGLGYSFSRVVEDPVLHHVHPPSTTFVAQHPKGEYGGHVVRFDAEGLVVDPDAPAERPTAPRYPRIAFLGDSFVEAIQVPFRESFVGLLEASAGPDAAVRNYGVSSYSPVLYLLQYRKLVSRFQPSHVVLMLYGNDVWDDIQYLKRARIAPSGDLEGVPGQKTNLIRRILRHSYLFQFVRKYEMQLEWMVLHRDERRGRTVGGFLEEHPDIPPESEKAILDLQQGVIQERGMLILTAVPSKYVLRKGPLPEGETEYADKVEAWARAHGIPFVPLGPAFREARARGEVLFLESDIHFTAAGHAVVARTLQAAYPDLFPGPLPPSAE